MTEPLAGELPGRAPPAPLTGAQRLAAALADTHPINGGRGTFRTLTGAVPSAAARLAGVDAELSRCIDRYAHPRVRARLHLDRRFFAADLLHAAVRALCTAPVALRRLTGDGSATLPAGERLGVTDAIRRTALVVGVDLDEVAQRRLTDAALASFVDALAQP